MNAVQANSRRWWTLSPLFGSLVFIVLYTMAAAFYPGGSQADAHAKGFSWMHNYWCNLLNEKALNGESNAARPFAWTAMAILLLSLLCFWAVATQGLLSSRTLKNTAFFSGTASVLLLPFLPTGFHDVIINTSGLFGLVALLLVYRGLYKNAWHKLFAFGMVNLVLIALNNYLYYGASFYCLPLVQKVTFASFLLWICLVTVKLYRHPKGQA